MKETKNVFMSELTEVFSKRQQQFVQFAYSYVRNREEAEDIVMGAFTNVWEHRNELQEDTNISALLLTAIKNRSLNHLQHLEVRMRAEQHIGDMRQKELALRISTLEACDPDKLFCDEIQALVQEAISELPPTSREPNNLLLTHTNATHHSKKFSSLGNATVHTAGNHQNACNQNQQEQNNRDRKKGLSH